MQRSWQHGQRQWMIQHGINASSNILTVYGITPVMQCTQFCFTLHTLHNTHTVKWLLVIHPNLWLYQFKFALNGTDLSLVGALYCHCVHSILKVHLTLCMSRMWQAMCRIAQHIFHKIDDRYWTFLHKYFINIINFKTCF